MAGGPGSYVLGAEERKEVLDVLDGGNLFRYGTPGGDGFQAKVVTFENEMAERLGHKHVVATSSGTGSLMCCLAALGIGMGDEVIVHEDAHVLHYEGGSAAALSGLQLRPLPGALGVLAPDDVEGAIRPASEHFAHTGAVEMENTHNRCSGTPLTSTWPLAGTR